MTTMAPTARDRRLGFIQSGFFGITILTTIVVVIPVFVVLAYVISNGIDALSPSFIFDQPERGGREGGIWPVIVMTMYALIMVLIFAVPTGVLCAIYLAEYAHPGRLLRTINLTIINLAGVPSIVYGLFGAAFFFDVIGTEKALWVASATLAMQALAIIITSSREALFQVPRGLREGSLAIGVSKLRTTFFIVVPQALGGIVTGVLLAISRAAGETAPILVVGAIAASTRPLGPESIFNERAQMLSFELYFRITEGLGVAEERKWAIGLTLLIVVLVFNISALLLRMKIQGMGAARRN